jgi:hypothetical protein
MNGLFWLLGVGASGWLTGRIIGGKGYGDTWGSNATNGLDALLGIMGGSVGSYLFSLAISSQGNSFNRYTTAILVSIAFVGIARQLSAKYLLSSSQ